MDHFSLTRFFVWLLLSGLSFGSFAETISYNGALLYRVGVSSYFIGGRPEYSGSSPSGAATSQAWFNAQSVGCRQGSYIPSSSGNDAGSWKITCTGGYTVQGPIDFSCRSDVKINNGSVNWGCWSSSDPANACKPAGTLLNSADVALTWDGGVTGASGCMSGCGVQSQGVQFCASGSDGVSHCYIFGPHISTGQTCSGSVSQPSVTQASDTAASCAKQGLTSGTINGKVSCVTPGSTTTVKSASSSASGVSTSASGVQSSTGTTSGTSTSTTTCQGSKCTTTTTTTSSNPDGSSGTGTSTKTQDKGDFCKENPKDTQCGNGGSFGGACGAFTCDGDAVQCAIAKEQYQRNCRLFDDQTDLSQAGNDIADGQTQPSGHPGSSPDVRAWNSSFDTTNAFGNSCPSDFAFNALGHSVNVPISGACDVLRVMGYAALAFTYLAAAKLVFGGFAGGGA